MEMIMTTILIALGSGFAGAFSGWFFGRKKQHLETIDYALETWKKVVDHLETRINVMLEQTEKLQQRISELEKENKSLRDDLQNMNHEFVKFKELQKKISKYEIEIKELKEINACLEKLLNDNKIAFKK